MTDFSALSSLNGGTVDTFYRDSEYPYDLNASLDYVRPYQFGPAYYPTIPTIGMVSGFLPLFNKLTLDMMFGKTPYGVWVGEVPNDFGLKAIFPNQGGGLRKVTG